MFDVGDLIFKMRPSQANLCGRTILLLVNTSLLEKIAVKMWITEKLADEDRRSEMACTVRDEYQA